MPLILLIIFVGHCHPAVAIVVIKAYLHPQRSIKNDQTLLVCEKLRDLLVGKIIKIGNLSVLFLAPVPEIYRKLIVDFKKLGIG